MTGSSEVRVLGDERFLVVQAERAAMSSLDEIVLIADRGAGAVEWRGLRCDLVQTDLADHFTLLMLVAAVGPPDGPACRVRDEGSRSASPSRHRCVKSCAGRM